MDIREKCRAFAAERCATYDASHDILHIDRVVKNTLKILSLSDNSTKEKIQLDILVAIASLHDTLDHKYLTTEEAATKAKSEVIEFLVTECGFAPDVVEIVLAVIDNMGFTSEISGKSNKQLPSETIKYLEIVQDADRLDAIGAVGIARCFAYIGAFKMPMISESGRDELDQRNRFTEGQLQAAARRGKTAIEIFYDKLVFLKDRLKTPPGKALGEERHNFMLAFLDRFFDDISG